MSPPTLRLLLPLLLPGSLLALQDPTSASAGTLRLRRNPMRLASPRPLSIIPVDGTPAIPGRQAPTPRQDDLYRLPKHFTTAEYHLTITPFFDPSFIFEGQVEIVLTCLNTTDVIVLHFKNLTFEDSSVTLEPDAFRRYNIPITITRDEELQQLRIKSEETLTANSRYFLTFKKFAGELSETPKGFYRASYVEGGKTRWMAVTQFEPTYARSVFPCLDEPEFKAHFQLTIEHESGYTALSNMPQATSTSGTNGRIKATFGRTPLMSTYLLAFAVANYSSINNSQSNFSVWARKDVVDGGIFGQTLGEVALESLGQYTGIQYALPKMDFIATQTRGGAMENWGLVTFGEDILIMNELTSTPVKQFIASTVYHEVAHQWFGNLVTLDWWSHTWLNEGITTYFEYYISKLPLAEELPEMKLMDQFLTAVVHTVFEMDAEETQHAMNSDAFTPSQIHGKFDTISYYKGAAVMRMFAFILTQPAFDSGLQTYLKTKANKNASPEDLYDLLQAQARGSRTLPVGIDFRDFAKSWTDQPGFPVVSVTRDYATGTATLTQERFLDAAPKNESLLRQRYYVPLSWVSQGQNETAWGNMTPMAWMSPEQGSVSLPTGTEISEREWIVVNPGHAGYYRVNYDLRNWNLLANALTKAPLNFTAQVRAQLLNDAFALAHAKKLDYSTALAITGFLPEETDLVAWQAALSVFEFLQAKLVNTKIYSTFLLYLSNVTAKVFEELGLKVNQLDSHDRKMLRYYMASWACHAGNRDCNDEAAQVLAGALTSASLTILPDIADPVMCYGVRNSDESFNTLRARWFYETDSEAKSTYLAAMSCTSNKELLRTLLSEASEQSELVPAFLQLAARSEIVPELFTYLKDTVKDLDNGFGDDGNSTGVLLEALIVQITTPDFLQEARKFVDDVFTGKKPYDCLQEALKRVEANLEWYNAHYQQVSDALYAITQTEAPPPPTDDPNQPSTDPSDSTEPPRPNGATRLRGSYIPLLLTGLLTLIVLS